MTQFNDILNLILKVATFICVVPDVNMKTAELCGVLLGPVFAQGLWLTVMDLLLDGPKYIFSCVHEFCVFGVLGDISFFMKSSYSCGRSWFVQMVLPLRSSSRVVIRSSGRGWGIVAPSRSEHGLESAVSHRSRPNVGLPISHRGHSEP